tara:strand:+ start:659 stop:808 length:150 start_codon:yes stop_codon:yes gene_type:complete
MLGLYGNMAAAFWHWDFDAVKNSGEYVAFWIQGVISWIPVSLHLIVGLF